MKTHESKSAAGCLRWNVWGPALALALTLTATAGEDTGQLFPSPDKAAAALAEVVKSGDRDAFRKLFGLGADELLNPDGVQAANELAAFAEAFEQAHRLVAAGPGRAVLEVGTNRWPFPVPLVLGPGAWHFDLAAGRDELLNRRIGRNELGAIDTCRAYVQAQREYAGQDHDADSVLEYAQRIGSTPGKQDGLYWPVQAGQALSPLGPLVAAAQVEGYRAPSGDETREPYHGYLFKILTRQGGHAPGGKYDYIINGNMIGGFALVAWPARYGETGIMTFMVNQQGRVYQKNLGPKTDKLAPAIKEYDPDASWALSPD